MKPRRSIYWRQDESYPLSPWERVRVRAVPDAGNPPVRFDEREVETEHGEVIEATADERAGHG
jgi:hypothetical protein